MYLVKCAIVLVFVFDAGCLARKTKRKDNYRLNVPPPPPPPPSPSQGHAEVSPYQYEDIQHGDYPGPVQQLSHIEHEFMTLYNSGTAGFASSSGATGGGGGGGGVGVGSGNFLTDNGLRSIAKGSADQANSAVANQNAAGKQAAYVAKSTLAHAAAQAAGTAVAVLKGKELLLRRLEEQSAESHRAIDGELAQLQQAKRSAKAAQYAAQQAINHVSVLTAALNNAQASAEQAQKAASEAAAELASQIDMVAQAKAKLEHIETQLYNARFDYEETQDSVAKATQSAQEAQLNANDAAVHANVELSESVVLHQAHDHLDGDHVTVHEHRRRHQGGFIH